MKPLIDWEYQPIFLPIKTNQTEACKTSGTPPELGFKQSVVSSGQSTPDLSK